MDTAIEMGHLHECDLTPIRTM